VSAPGRTPNRSPGEHRLATARRPARPGTGRAGATADEMDRLMARLTRSRDLFFREPRHFADLQLRLFRAHPSALPLSVWSADCGSGEEAWSIAMLLADKLGDSPWRVVGTDPSPDRIAAARRACYPRERARLVPEAYLARECLHGTGALEDQLVIGPRLRGRVAFEALDLRQPLPGTWPRFDAIFLRNVLGRLDARCRARVLDQVLDRLQPDGVLYTGHGETIVHAGRPLRQIAPAVHAFA
jgi:chemotaxis protein methyltransferase CheR